MIGSGGHGGQSPSARSARPEHPARCVLPDRGHRQIGWLADPSPLTERLTGYLEAANRWNLRHLESVCLPYAPIFARLVLFGELVLNILFAGSLLFQNAMLTNGYALPVHGGLLALALGGVGLPLSSERTRSRKPPEIVMQFAAHVFSSAWR